MLNLVPLSFCAAIAVADLKGHLRAHRRGRHAEPPYWVRELARLRAYHAAGALSGKGQRRMARLEARLARRAGRASRSR